MKKKTAGLMAVMVCVCSAAFGAEKPMVALQIASLEQLAAEAVTLKVLPESSAKTTIAAGLGGLLGNPNLAGVDTAKPIDVYVFFSKPENTASNAAAGHIAEPQVAAVFPATSNGMDCIAAIGRAFPSTNKIGSIYEFSAPLGTTGLQRKRFVALVAGRIIAGNKMDGVREAINLVESQRGDSPLFMELPGTIRVGVDIQAALPFLQTMSQAATAKMANHGPAKPGQPDPEQMLGAEMEMMLKLLEDIQGLAFTVRVTPTSVTLCSRVDPKDGTSLSALLSKDVPPSARYMALPPADALCSWVGSGMDKWMDVFGEPYLAMMDKMSAAMGSQGVDMGSAIRQIMTDTKGLYAGDIAAAIVPDTDGKLGFVEFLAVTDPVKAKLAMDKMMSSSSNFAGASGLTVRVGEERSYKDVKVQACSYAVNAASNAPPLAMSNFIGKMRWEIAYAGNHMVYAMRTSELMNSAIDRLSATDNVPVTSTRQFTSVFPPMKEPPSHVYTLSLVKLAKAGLALRPGANAARLASIPDKTRGMAGYGVIKGDNMICIDRIMLDEIEGLKVVLPMLKNDVLPSLAPPGSASPRPPQAYKSTSSCASNLRMINAAKELVASDKGLKKGDPVDPADMAKYLRGGKLPVCPDGGQYTIGPIGCQPECSTDRPGQTYK